MKLIRWLLAGTLLWATLSLAGCDALVHSMVDYEGIRAKYEAVVVYRPAPSSAPRFDRLSALEVANGALTAMLDSKGGGPCVGGAEWESVEQRYWITHDAADVQRQAALSQAIRVTGYSLDGEALDVACASAPQVHLAVQSQGAAPAVTSYSDAIYVDDKTGLPSSTANRPYWVQLTPADGFVRKWMGLDVEKGGTSSTEQQRRQTAVDFVDAWYALSIVPAVDTPVDAAFSQVAARYRAGPPDPQPPEDVHRLRVLAEAAIRDKKLIVAAKHYGSALAIAPWWPTGRFNRALILAELKLYPEAADEMKRYLLLVPNAANARAAQDKVYEWEAKAGG